MLRSHFLWKLYAGFAALLVLTTAGLGLLASRWLESELLESIRDGLRTRTIPLRSLAVDALQRYEAIDDEGEAEEFRAALHRRLVKLHEDMQTGIAIIQIDGEVLADSSRLVQRPGSLRDRPEIISAAEGRGIGIVTDETEGTVLVAMRVRGQRLRPLGFVRTAIPLAEVDRLLAELRSTIYLGTLVSTLVALGLCFVIARRVTRRLVSVASAAEDFSAGDHSRRVAVSSSDEIGKLGRAFNSMADSIGGQIATIDHERNQLRAILAGMVEGVIAVDTDTRVLHINEVAARILRIQRDEARGRRIREVTRVREVCEVLDLALSGAQLAHRECQVSGGSTEPIVQMQSSPLHLVGGRIAGAVVVLHDISALRQLETVRQDFVANVSHELKTPLTAIQGLVETILGDREMAPEIRERFLDKIRGQSNRLGVLVRDLLSLSRIESEEEIRLRTTVDLRVSILRAVEAVQPAAEAKGIEFVTRLPEEQVVGESDPEALEQILTNLLDNAVKYSTTDGAVEVELRATPEEAVIDVRDEGIGIAPAHQQRIFERFYRVDKARSREVGGTGLGLAIVKHLVQALSGRIELESEFGEGSTFRVHLPLG